MSSDDIKNKTKNEMLYSQMRAQLKESEEIGNATLTRLQEQREKLVKIKETNLDTQAQLGDSNRLLGKMGKWWRG